MKVDITLYKTNFDEENPFVSISKEQRNLDISNTFNENKLVMENASFNIEEPFRIAKNFFDLDKKYNYAKYEYYNGNELKDTRFYFIRDFQYVNDNITDMIVAEDIIGEHFWDLNIKYCMPQKYTYKKNDLKDRVFDTKNSPCSTFKIKNEFSLLEKTSVKFLPSKPIDYEYLDEFYVGFLVVSAVFENFFINEDDGYMIYKKNEYIEDGVNYGTSTFLLPFFYNENFEILNYNIANLSWGRFSIISADFIGLKDFSRLSTITSNGFKYVSSFIMLDTKGFIDFVAFDTENKNFIIKLSDNFIKDAENIVFETSSEASDEKTVQLFKINKFISKIGEFETDNNINQIYPYNSIKLSVDGNIVDLDTASILENENNKLKININQSLIPPYQVVFSFNSEKLTKKYIELERNSSFMYVDDTFTEWLKSNRNSSITGLQVKQNFEEWINDRQALTTWSSALSRKTFSGNIPNAFGEIVGGYQDVLSRFRIFDENKRKEQNLLYLKIHDIMNTPDKVAFGSSAFFYMINNKFIKISEMENIRFEEIDKSNKIYGYNNYKEINDIVSHSIFDYIRTDTLTLSFKNDFNPNEIERTIIENYFSSGIRIWYSVENYKNFNIDNEEI